MAFIHTERQFYLVRLLLGSRGGRIFSGVIVYLTIGSATRKPGKSSRIFLLPILFLYIIGSPLAACSWDLMAWLGMAVAVIIEGIPAVLFDHYHFLSHGLAEKARWLPSIERSDHRRIAARKGGKEAHSLLQHLGGPAPPRHNSAELCYFLP